MQKLLGRDMIRGKIWGVGWGSILEYVEAPNAETPGKRLYSINDNVENI